MSEILTDDETDVSSLASGRDDEDSGGDCMTKDLIAMILQFMEASGLHESYRSFWNECDSFGFPMPPEGQSVLLIDSLNFGPRDANLLFKYFDFEEKEELLAQWAKFIQAIELEQQQDFKKITFFVRIFAAIIPFRKNEDAEIKSKSMGELRDFFQEKSDEFSTDEKMLSLFALPFVADPATHPVFKEIFQDSWKNKLRSQLSLSIKKYCEFNNLPTIASTDLVQLYLSPQREDFDDEEENKSRFLSTQQDVMSARTLQSVHDNLKTMESSLLDVELRYHKLLKVTAEMVGALEATVQGEAQDMTALRNRVTGVFPELFNAFQGPYHELTENPSMTSQAGEHQSDFDDEGILSVASDPYDSETDAELKLFKTRRRVDTQLSESEVPPKENYDHHTDPKEHSNYIPPPPESLYDRGEPHNQEQGRQIPSRPEKSVSPTKDSLSPTLENLKSEGKSTTQTSERNSETRIDASKPPESRDSQSSKLPTPPYSLKSTKGGEAFTVMNTNNSPAKKRSYAKTIQPTPFSAQHPTSQTRVGKKRWSVNSAVSVTRDSSTKTPVRKSSKTIQPRQI